EGLHERGADPQRLVQVIQAPLQVVETLLKLDHRSPRNFASNFAAWSTPAREEATSIFALLGSRAASAWSLAPISAASSLLIAKLMVAAGTARGWLVPGWAIGR